ncbi:MAG: mitofilin family membrane protein [Phenylobacterium sp.]
MSAADEADLTAPRDPASYARRGRRGLGLAALGATAAVALAAGWVIGAFGPRPGPITSLPAAIPASEPALPPAPRPGPLAPAPFEAPAAEAPPALGEVSQRLARLEQAQARTARASAAALAAATLMSASRGASGFTAELAAARAAAPGLPELAALEPLARVGAPSRAALASSFPEYAAKAAAASHAPGEHAGLFERLGHAFSRVVTIRRVGEVTGEGPDAVLARAERLVEDGDINLAVHTLQGLPPAGREALGPWLVRAERRAEIDRRIAALGAEALAELGRQAQARPETGP